MIGKTNSINLLGGGDTQTANYITVADTLGNLVQAFKMVIHLPTLLR